MQRSIIEKAFEIISEYERIRILNSKEKKINNYKDDIIVWEVNTEVSCNNKLIGLLLHVFFTNQFPLEFPKIFIAPENYKTINNLPHIDTDRLICTFDTEVTTPNPDEPVGVIIETLKRAKRIIEAGLEKKNFIDFEEEFISYWEGKYEKEVDYPVQVLSLIDKLDANDSLKVIILEDKLSTYKYIIHKSDDSYNEFKLFLEKFKIKYTEQKLFFVTNTNLPSIPPFNISNKDSLRYIDKEYEKDVIHYINSKSKLKLIIFKKVLKDEEYFFGWSYENIKMHHNGYRQGKYKPFDSITKSESNKLVRRISTERYTLNRLENRSNGNISDKKRYIFSIIGLGSIGSHILYYLNSLNTPEFRLIDTDTLKVENLGRHFLGFNYVGYYKTIALEHYIKLNNPLQKILTQEKSIDDVVYENPEFLNNSDYLFVAIGNSNFENLIGEAITNKIIRKPTFFIWVEPYLAGGHCVYINPNGNAYSDYFEKDLFRFNIISNNSYKVNLNQLSLKEAGCQTTFTPYSLTNITGFLSMLYNKIVPIIEKNHKISTSFTWIGNTEVITSMGLELSEIGKNNKSGTIIENVL